MYLAETTVKNYVSSLLHKLGFARRTEAAVSRPSCAGPTEQPASPDRRCSPR